MRQSNQGSSSWGLDAEEKGYQDLSRFMTDAGGLAQELLSEGITAMKIWPFDLFAERNRGLSISDEELNTALKPVVDIRNTVGSDIDLMIEMHSLWDIAPAKKIMRAMADFNIFWVEDPLFPDFLDEYSELREDGLPKIAHGETIASKARVEQLTKQNYIDYLTLDLGWCGGFSQGIEFAKIAQTHGVKIAPHDCTGPIGLLAGAHLSMAFENAAIQETVRAALRTWYPHIVTDLPLVTGGNLSLSNKPGLGTSLKSSFTGDAQMNRQVIS